MTMRNLLLTSLVGGALAVLIVAAAEAALQGGPSSDGLIRALLVGAGSAVSLFFVFLWRVGEKSC